jgi:hypothetical protein
MADNYTQFSFTLKKLTKAEIKWIKKVLSYSIDVMGDVTDDAVELAKLLNTKANKVTGESLEYWPDFEWELEKNTLNIYAQESGNEVNVAAFVHAFLFNFRPKDIVTFGVAYTCSKMRADEFGGQEWVITAHDIISTGDIAHNIYEALAIGHTKNTKVSFSSIDLTIHKFKRGERK